MKRFAVLFAAAICMVAFSANQSEAQCAGGGFYGGYGGYRGVGVNVYRGGGFYRPSIGYGYARPVYGGFYGRPAYGYGYGHRGYGRHYGYGGYRGGGVTIRW